MHRTLPVTPGHLPAFLNYGKQGYSIPERVAATKCDGAHPSQVSPLSSSPSGGQRPSQDCTMAWNVALPNLTPSPSLSLLGSVPASKIWSALLPTSTHGECDFLLFCLSFYLGETQKGQVSAAGVGDSEERKGQQLNVTSASSLSVSPGLRVTEGQGRLQGLMYTFLLKAVNPYEINPL